MKNLRGDLQHPENNDDCRTLAPFVMTLFDGEADELEARRARAHLLVCQTCARRWLDWNRSRDLLQSAPVPAPPPQLLWRVLMACRLAGAPKAAPRSTLSTQILARTTRMAPVTGPPRCAAWLQLPTLAAPALALWMLVLQRDVWLPAPAAPPTRSITPALSHRAARPAPAVTPRQHLLHTPRAAPRRAAPPVAVSAVAQADVITAPTTALLPVSHTRARHTDTPRALMAVSMVMAPLSASKSETRAIISWSPPRLAPIVLPRMPERVAAAPRRALARLAATHGRNAAPRLRAASWQNAENAAPRANTPGANTLGANTPGTNLVAGRLLASDDRDSAPILRVSLPSVPAPQPTRLLAENFDSDDARVEAARSVVDDFRATLETDEFSAETGDEENTG